MSVASKYTQDYDEQAYKLALLGLIDDEIAEYFEISKRTLIRWRERYPSFREATAKGKQFSDANVAEKLYKSAIGENYILKEKAVVANDKVHIVEVREQLPPNVGAMTFWLKNRQKDKWRSRVQLDVKQDKDAVTEEWIKDNFEKIMEKSEERQDRIEKD